MRVHRVSRRVMVGGLVGALLFTTGGCARFEARRDLKKGNALYRAGKFEEAIGHYANVPPDTSDGIRAALNTGYAHWRQYRFGSKHPVDLMHATKAVEAFERYLKARPEGKKDSKAFPDVGKIEERIITLLIDVGQFKDAIARLEAKLATNPDDPAILRGIATAYDKWGKPTMAVRYFQKWAELFPDQESPHVAIAAYAWNMSYRRHMEMEPLERNRWIDTGLAAADRALAINDQHFEATTYKNLLLRERAKMRIDPDEIAALMGQATELLAKAKEIRARQKAADKAKAEETAKKEAEQKEAAGSGAS